MRERRFERVRETRCGWRLLYREENISSALQQSPGALPLLVGVRNVSDSVRPQIRLIDTQQPCDEYEGFCKLPLDSHRVLIINFFITSTSTRTVILRQFTVLVHLTSNDVNTTFHPGCMVTSSCSALAVFWEHHACLQNPDTHALPDSRDTPSCTSRCRPSVYFVVFILVFNFFQPPY